VVIKAFPILMLFSGKKLRAMKIALKATCHAPNSKVSILTTFLFYKKTKNRLGAFPACYKCPAVDAMY